MNTGVVNVDTCEGAHVGLACLCGEEGLNIIRAAEITRMKLLGECLQSFHFPRWNMTAIAHINENIEKRSNCGF